MGLTKPNALDPSVFEVVQIVLALLIHKHTAINVAHLLDSQVSCDWVIFIKFDQWHALLEPFMAIPNVLG